MSKNPQSPAPSKTEKTLDQRRVIAVLTDNEFGSLARVVSLFSARGYNIESLSVAVIDQQANLSRITITTYGSQPVIDLIIKLLERLVPVHKAVDLSAMPNVERALALLKVKNDEKNKAEILRIAEIFQAELIKKDQKYFIFQLAAEPKKIDEIIALLTPYGLVESEIGGSSAIALNEQILQAD